MVEQGPQLVSLPFEVLLVITDNLLPSDIVSLGCTVYSFWPSATINATYGTFQKKSDVRFLLFDDVRVAPGRLSSPTDGIERTSDLQHGLYHAVTSKRDLACLSTGLHIYPHRSYNSLRELNFIRTRGTGSLSMPFLRA